MYLSHPLHLSKCPVMSTFALRSRYQRLLSIATMDRRSRMLTSSDRYIPINSYNLVLVLLCTHNMIYLHPPHFHDNGFYETCQSLSPTNPGSIIISPSFNIFHRLLGTSMDIKRWYMYFKWALMFWIKIGRNIWGHIGR